MNNGDGDLARRLRQAVGSRAEQEAEALLDDAFASAREQVAAAVEAVARRALTEAVIERLGPTPMHQPGLRDGARSPEHPVPAEDVGTTAGWYLYGIMASDTALVEADTSGVDGQPLQWVDTGGLRAVVSEVDAESFDASLEERRGDEQWVERKVRAHDDVLRTLSAAGPLIPLRFGTILAGTGDAEALLARHRGALERTLQRLRGTAEWGVKGRWDAASLRAHVAATSDDERVLEPGLAQGSTGTSYLRGKSRDQAVSRDADRVREAVLGQCHERLAREAREAALLPVRSVGPRQDEELVLNASYLVSDQRLDAFRDALAGLSAEYADMGLDLELTGPWPPYSFVGDELLEEGE